MSICDVSFLGNIQDCRTEAEISYSRPGGSSEVIAAVWEDDDGGLVAELGDVFLEAIENTKRRLQRYVNRRGTNPPEGLSPAGLSLWLMLKDDGTAMGKPYPG